MDQIDTAQLAEIKYKSLIDYLGKSTESYPDKPAFIFKDQPLSYRQFSAHVDSCARVLFSLGLQKGKTVALILPNILEFSILYFALLKNAVRILPVNIMLNADDLSQMLQESQTDAVFVWHQFTTLLASATKDSSSSPKTFIIDQAGSADNLNFYQRFSPGSVAGAVRYPALKKDDDALVFYTAGTSEATKGAVFTHENLSCTLRSLWETLLISDMDMVMAVLPLFHPFGQLVTMNVPLAAGATIVLHSKLDIDQIIDSIAKHRITYLLAVPGVFDEIARRSPSLEALKSVRVCLASGALLKDGTYDLFLEKYNLTILEGYGVTECSPLVSCSRIYRERRRGSVGLPLPDIELAILDEKYQPQSPMGIGEIGLRSKSLLRAYLGAESALDASIKNGWFLTGDMGLMDVDGYLYLIDRKADIILKDGFHISPIDVEKVLTSHANVQLAAVIAVPNNKHGEIIRAYVVPTQNDTLNASELKNFCQTQLPPYKCPDEIDIVQDLPRTATGKVLKRELRKRLNETNESTNGTINRT